MSQDIQEAIQDFTKKSVRLQEITKERKQLEGDIAALDDEARGIISSSGAPRQTKIAKRGYKRSQRGGKRSQRGGKAMQPRQDIIDALPKDFSIENNETLGRLVHRISKAIAQPMTSIEFACCADRAGYKSKSANFADVMRQVLVSLVSTRQMLKTTRGRSRPIMWLHR